MKDTRNIQEKLQALLPDVYAKHLQEEFEKSEELYQMFKRSLGIIEVIYLQNPSEISFTKAEVYASLIQRVQSLGFDYAGNADIIAKAGKHEVMQDKKPMQKAGVKKQKSSQDLGQVG